jgi:hypothetical protein
MCRPSCCKPSNEGAGITAIAVIAAGAIIAVKLGPVVARIIHLVIEVLIIIMLTAASALACILLAWVTVCIVRWQRRRQQAHQQAGLRAVATPARLRQAEPGPGCLACGDTGQVLHAIGSRYQAQPCPACEPATRAR